MGVRLLVTISGTQCRDELVKGDNHLFLAPLFLSRPRCWQQHLRPCSSRNRAITFASDSTRVLSRSITLVYTRVVEVRTCQTSIVAKLLRAGDVVWGGWCGIAVILWYVHYRILGIPARRPGSNMTRTGSRLQALEPRRLISLLHNLPFLPSYFHSAIRIGASTGHNPQGNPIAYVYVSLRGKDISAAIVA